MDKIAGLDEAAELFKVLGSESRLALVWLLNAEPLTVADMARAARLSPAHFSREFKAAFGEAPHQYLLTRRLERAAYLLRNTDRSVADVCVMVGLSSVGSFTTSFKSARASTCVSATAVA